MRTMTIKELIGLYERYFDKLELLENTVSELEIDEEELNELINISKDLQHSLVHIVKSTKELLIDKATDSKIV